MITVTLTEDTSPEKIAAVREFCGRELLTNPGLNGAEINITAGDFVQVKGADEITGAVLLASIYRII